MVGSSPSRVGQNRVYTPFMTVYLVIPLPKIPYIHRMYIWFWPTLSPSNSLLPVWMSCALHLAGMHCVYTAESLSAHRLLSESLACLDFVSNHFWSEMLVLCTLPGVHLHLSDVVGYALLPTWFRAFRASGRLSKLRGQDDVVSVRPAYSAVDTHLVQGLQRFKLAFEMRKGEKVLADPRFGGGKWLWPSPITCH